MMNSKIKIGLMTVFDPRIKNEVREDILSKLGLADKIRRLGIETVVSEKTIDNEEDAVKVTESMRTRGVCGIIYYTAWFLRANTIVGACMSSQLPALIWVIPDMDNAAMVGFGVTHGSVEEAGIQHEVICDNWNEESQKKMLAWARACYVKKSLVGSRYGQIGGRCLSMLPADTDDNQWRWMFGIDVDHAEQWTLIHEAEKISKEKVNPLIDNWKKEFASIDVSDEVLIKSARVYLAGKEMFLKNKWDFAGIKCQFELIDNYLAPCLPVALWNDEGFVVACESDKNAALTMLVLQRLNGRPVMFADIQYIDCEKGLARFLNCGTAATYLAGGKDRIHLRNCPDVQGTLDKVSGKSLCKGGACPHFILPPGGVTLARFGRIKGKYVLHVALGESIEYPHDKNSLLGIGGIWPFAYVKIKQDISLFIQNLRAHHICISFGDWKKELDCFAGFYGIEIL